jgi:superfamily II DNA or RNA helicase
MQDYRYQESLVAEAYKKLIENPKLPVIMACAPNAGKTRMAIRIADLFEKDFPNSNILFLTHGQILIREQWVNYFQKFFPENFEPTVIRKSKDLDKKRNLTNVLVGLPQTLKRIKGRVDLLIVDEAHQRYLATEIQEIIKVLRPKHQLLLTGTPSLFIRQQGFQLVGITLSELLRKNIVGDPIIELASSTYSYDEEDYTKDGDVSKYNFQTIDTNATLNNLLTEIVKKMSSKKRTDPESFKWCTETMDWKTVLRGFKKTMFVCANQQHARDVH